MLDDTEAMPAGFALWPFNCARRGLMLPTLVVRDLVLQENQRKEESRQKYQAQANEAEAGRVKTDLEVRLEEASKMPSTDLVMARYPDHAEPGFHRVLPRFSEFTSQIDAADANFSVVDGNILEARNALRKRLRARGPDRRIAQPCNGADALRELEALQPNFCEPLRLLRNILKMADAVAKPVRIPPILLLGPPGVGKTFFTHGLAEAMGTQHAAIAFDQPTAGSQLRGSDKHWSNTESGLLFNMLCLGDFANPVILLDEVDKAFRTGASRDTEPLAQLHAALEPQTSSRLLDISTEIEFDASLVTYVATANSLEGLSPAILSRFEVFYIQPPTAAQSMEIAYRMAQRALQRWDLKELRVDRSACTVLAALTPRMIQRTLEKVIAEALATGARLIDEDAIWRELGMNGGPGTLH